MTVGEVYEIDHKGGTAVQGKLLGMWEDGEFEWFRFDILDNGGIDEDGRPDPNERYIVDYCQRKTVDYSGIEKATNMPSAYAGKSLEDFNWSFYPGNGADIRVEVTQFLSHFKKYQAEGMGLYLRSNTKGSGKTLLACCIANEVMKRYGMRTKFINTASYVQAVKDGAAQEFKDATILILDDFGVQDESKAWIADVIYELIDHRDGHHLLTIFTSNLPKSSCCNEERTASRVYEMALEIKMPEISVRKVLADMRIKAFKESLNEEHNPWK